MIWRWKQFILINFLDDALKERADIQRDLNSLESLVRNTPYWECCLGYIFYKLRAMRTVSFDLEELPVLGLAEMELTFPIAALSVLCFALIGRKVLVTHPYFGYC